MWLTAAELRLVIDGLQALMARQHKKAPKYIAANKLRGEFQHKYDTVRLLDIEDAKR